MSDTGEYSWKGDPVLWAYSILMFVPIIMAIFFYNHHGLDFLVYSGWILIVFSVVLIFVAGGEFRNRGQAPEGESIVHTMVLVDSGIYAIIRHPQYLGFILIVLSLVLISQHWIGAISGLLGTGLFYRDILREEQMSIARFGDVYREYMDKVPRMNLLRGAIRLLNRKGKGSS